MTSESTPDEPRDPKIVNELPPGALNIEENVLTPLFQNFQTTAADQLKVSEGPDSTSNMAAATQEETSENDERSD